MVAPAAYDEFLAIPGNISSSMRLTNMSSLTAELEQPGGYRYVPATDSYSTYPLTTSQRLLHNINLQKRHSNVRESNRAT